MWYHHDIDFEEIMKIDRKFLFAYLDILDTWTGPDDPELCK